MPTYVYECAKCGDEFELYQSFSEDPLKKHPGCGGKVAKVFQPVGIVLKGSGFYKNDSRSGGKKSKGADATKVDSGSKTESKSDTSTAGSSKSDGAKKSDNELLVVGQEVGVVDVRRQVVVVSAAGASGAPPSLPRPSPDPVPAACRGGRSPGRTRHAPTLSPRARALGRGGRGRRGHRSRGRRRPRRAPPTRPPTSAPRSTPSSPPATCRSGRVPTSRDLSTRSVHRSQLPSGVVVDRRTVVGRVVAVPVLDGAYLVRRNVAPRRRTGLDGVVPPGMRAMRVVVTDALTPRPGAAVDVLATYDPSSAGERGRHDRGGRGRDRAGHRPTGWRGRGPQRCRGGHAARRPRAGDRAGRRRSQRRGHARAGAARGRRPAVAASSISALSVLHAIILGIVQGLSEFLPISSSGHLIIVPELFGWTELTSNDSLNKTFDVALHVGTLIAVLAYFRHEVWSYVVAAWHSLRTRSITTVDERLAWLLLLTAIPGAIIGALFTSVIEDNLGDPILIGINMILFGLVLQWADGLAGDAPDRGVPAARRGAHGRGAGARARPGRVPFGGDDLDGPLAAVRPGVGARSSRSS